MLYSGSVWRVKRVFMRMHAWSEGKPCVACHVNIVAMCGLANDMSGEVG